MTRGRSSQLLQLQRGCENVRRRTSKQSSEWWISAVRGAHYPLDLSRPKFCEPGFKKLGRRKYGQVLCAASRVEEKTLASLERLGCSSCGWGATSFFWFAAEN